MKGKILKKAAAAVLSLALMGGVLPTGVGGWLVSDNAVAAETESVKQIMVGTTIFMGDNVDFGDGAYYYSLVEYDRVFEEVKHTSGVAKNISRGGENISWFNEFWGFHDGSGRYGDEIFGVIVKDNAPEIPGDKPEATGVKCVSGDGTEDAPYRFEPSYDNGLVIGDVILINETVDIGEFMAYITPDDRRDRNAFMIYGNNYTLFEPIELRDVWEFCFNGTVPFVDVDKNGNEKPLGIRVVGGTGNWNDNYVFEGVYRKDLDLMYGDIDGNGELDPFDVLDLYSYIHQRTDDMDSAWIELHGDLFRPGDGVDDLDVMMLVQYMFSNELNFNEPVKELTFTDRNGMLTGYQATGRLIYPEVTFTKNSMTLGGAISLNFYVNFSDIPLSNHMTSYVEFEVGGNKQRADLDIRKMDSTRSDYCFTCKLNSVSMADVVKATLHYRDKNNEEKTLVTTATAEEYLNKFSDEDDEKIWNLIMAINDYGFYMQHYLAAHSGKPWILGVDHAAMTTSYKTPLDYLREYDHYRIELERYSKVKELDYTDISDISYSLTLDSDTAMNIIIKPVSGYKGRITVLLDGDLYTPKKVGDNYVVTVSGIAAHKLSDNHDVLVLTDNGNSVFEASALSYAYDALKKPLDNSEKLAMCALFDYYKAAVRYIS